MPKLLSRTSRHTGVCQYPVNKSLYLIAAFMGITMLLFALTPNALADDDLGRLFTTPEQRLLLEKLRHQQPVAEVKVPEIGVEFEEPAAEEEKPVIGGITVNGLVYRENGKSTAWINSENTFEGNLANQYIRIDARNIKPDDVEIVIPLNETRVKLKTGETYDPEMGQVVAPDF